MKQSKYSVMQLDNKRFVVGREIIGHNDTYAPICETKILSYAMIIMNALVSAEERKEIKQK